MTYRLRRLIPYLLVLTASVVWAETPPACPTIDYEAANGSTPRLAVDEVEGQAIASNPALPAQLVSIVNACLALFDEHTHRQVAATSCGEGGRFVLPNPGRGEFTLIARSSTGRGGSLRVPLQVSGATPTPAAPRGLLLRFDSLSADYTGHAEGLANLALRRELLEMLKTDQAIRQEMIDKGMASIAPELVQRMAAIDEKTRARLVEIVHQYGWPTIDKVGRDGAGAASTMLQHVAYETQKEFLPLVEAGYRAGKVEGSNYALLVDRIRDHEGIPELYGAGAELKEGKFVSKPIEDPAHVDERRAALGLMPLAQYLELMNRMYFPKKP